MKLTSWFIALIEIELRLLGQKSQVFRGVIIINNWTGLEDRVWQERTTNLGC